MQLRNAAIAAGLAVVLCTGTTFAQSNAPYPAMQQVPSGPQNQARMGKRAQIKADVQAGRISKAEGKQLKQQLKAERAQRRALKQARRAQRGYQPANYPSPPPPQQ